MARHGLDDDNRRRNLAGPLVVCPTVAGYQCPGCGCVLEEGQRFAALLVGPGADPVEQYRASVGEAYVGVTIPVHWSCATGEVLV